MIMSLAHAAVDEATSANVFGAWSNLVVGEKPTGLVACYLLKAEGSVQIAAIWESAEDHNQAIEEEGKHPAFAVFEASGLDPTHAIFEVVGHLH